MMGQRVDNISHKQTDLDGYGGDNPVDDAKSYVSNQILFVDVSKSAAW